MRASQLLAPTLREIPAEAEIISHKLMLRAGFIRKAAAGVYTYLPLSQRVLEKIRKIIREEMDAAGGQEIVLPIIQPAELWQESGRWQVYGDELFRLKDRHGREFALGPTHEEIITDLVRNEVRSYKQLPLLLYQIQNKYRDERRPRFGLMRGREFVMKDLYSFDRDETALEESYRKMYRAYENIFTRCGLKYRPVEADSGAIGGNASHEFMVLAEAGEAAIVFCDKCDYAANVEKAEGIVFDVANNPEVALELKEVSTPGQHTVAEVCAFLGTTPQEIIKTLLYHTDHGMAAILVRGDREANEIKLLKVLDTLLLDLAGETAVREVTGAEVGFAGPVGLSKEYQGQKIKIIADPEVMQLVNAVCGANKTDAHMANVNPGRDFKPDVVADVRLVRAGDVCPHCHGSLEEARGIEVGQVFKLGTKYSKALGATFLDEKGQEKTMVMGCYGIGVTRTMAAAIEQNNDADGIIWPLSIAPFQVIIVPVSMKEEDQRKVAEELYQALSAKGVEVLLDDRDERPGVKFKDADLIGYPVRVTIGAKSLAEGKVEVRFRKDGESFLVDIENAPQFLSEKVEAELLRFLPQEN